MRYLKTNNLGDLPTHTYNDPIFMIEPNHVKETWQYVYLTNEIVDISETFGQNFIEVTSQEFFDSIKEEGENPRFNLTGRVIFNAPEGTLGYIIQNGGQNGFSN